MYVCICNAISERELRSAAGRRGLSSAAMLFEAWQIGPVCGQCVAELDELLRRFADEAAGGGLEVAGRSG